MTINEIEEKIRVEMEGACKSRDEAGESDTRLASRFEGRRAGLAFALDLVRNFMKETK